MQSVTSVQQPCGNPGKSPEMLGKASTQKYRCLREGGHSMSTEENKAVIRRFVEGIHNEDNQHILDKLMAPNIFNHSAVSEHLRGFEPVV
jgi:hypothetical protein